MDFIPFFETADKDLNQVYTFRPKSSTQPFKPYNVEITVDGMMDGVLINTSCNCKGFMTKKNECKHIKEAIKILQKEGVEVQWFGKSPSGLKENHTKEI